MPLLKFETLVAPCACAMPAGPAVTVAYCGLRLRRLSGTAMHRRAVALAILLACTAVPVAFALEADDAPEAPQVVQRREWIAMAPVAPAVGSPTVTHISSWGDVPAFADKRVAGAPYCADAIHEKTQVLADGNRIVHKTSTRLCRDSQGRTRQESESGGRVKVYISDPVAQRHWVLDPHNKTATQSQISQSSGFSFNGARPGDAEAMRGFQERMRDWGKDFAERFRTQRVEGAKGTVPGAASQPGEPHGPAGSGGVDAGAHGNAQVHAPQPVVITEIRKEMKDGKEVVTESRVVRDAHRDSAPHVQRDVRVYRMAPDGNGLPAMPPAPPMPPLPPLHGAVPGAPHIHFGGAGGGFDFVAPRGSGTTTSLGARDIEGVKAQGEKTVWTIEAGKIGNEKPIVTTRETWTSPDLLLTVLSRDADPRSGESVYRLANLKRAEPDAALFKVPSDYTLRETNVKIVRSGVGSPKSVEKSAEKHPEKSVEKKSEKTQ